MGSSKSEKNPYEQLPEHPEMQKITIGMQSFATEEVHLAVTEIIQEFRDKGQIGDLKLIKNALIKPTLYKPTLDTVIHMAIARVAGRKITRESITQILWPFHVTQDLLGEIASVSYLVGATEVEAMNKQLEREAPPLLTHLIYNLLKTFSGKPGFMVFMTGVDFKQLPDTALETYADFSIAIMKAINVSTNNADDTEF